MNRTEAIGIMAVLLLMGETTALENRTEDEAIVTALRLLNRAKMADEAYSKRQLADLTRRIEEEARGIL